MNNKLIIEKIGGKYHEHHYKFNLDAPNTIDMRKWEYCENEEEYIYNFEH